MKAKQIKKRNPNDLTLRNARAYGRRLKAVEMAVANLAVAIDRIVRRSIGPKPE